MSEQMAPEERFCSRCLRPNPGDDMEWEAVLEDDGVVGVVCPSCLTGVDRAAIEEDAIAMGQCLRCGRERSVDESLEDWFTDDDEGRFVCPGCWSHADDEAVVERLRVGLQRMVESGSWTAEQAEEYRRTLDVARQLRDETDPLRNLKGDDA